jgi:hypothetical protein
MGQLPASLGCRGFVAAVLSHKKKTFLDLNIIRSDMQTFHHMIPELGKSQPRYRRRKKIWTYVINALVSIERNLVELGNFVADYRALVLFRTNISTPATLQPQIELGRAMFAQMQTWFKKPASKDARTRAAHLKSHEDTGRTVTRSVHEQLPQTDDNHARHKISRVRTQTQPKNAAHLQSTPMSGGSRKHDADYNMPKTNWRPKKEHTRNPNEDKDSRSTGVSDDILSVLRAAQFRP